MNHPELMLIIAHKREEELVREAVACGVPEQAEPDGFLLSRRLLSAASAVAAVILVLVRLFGR